jgi:hypothetical protein
MQLRRLREALSAEQATVRATRLALERARDEVSALADRTVVSDAVRPAAAVEAGAPGACVPMVEGWSVGARCLAHGVCGCIAGPLEPGSVQVIAAAARQAEELAQEAEKSKAKAALLEARLSEAEQASEQASHRSHAHMPASSRTLRTLPHHIHARAAGAFLWMWPLAGS